MCSRTHAVVCSQLNGERPGGRGAWVHIPTDDGADDDEWLARMWLEGERWDTEGPALGGLILRRGARALGRAAVRHLVLREPRARSLA